MNKLIKKALCLLIALVLSTGTLSLFGCGGGKEEEKVDETKTQIYVGNQNYGFGDAWLKSAIKKFEEANADVSFEDGKTGVQIFYTNGSAFGSNTLLQTIKTQGCDIFFGENTQYYDFISGGAMLDITDIVTEKLTKYGESRSIADKLNGAYSSYLKTAERKDSSGKVVVKENCYYALPNYECSYMLTYNKTYFDENSYFFDAFGNICKKSTDDGLSAGPDGIPDNYDDGLPATFEQFFELCARIDDDGGIPICWPGTIDSYKNVYITSLLAGIEGKAQYELGFNFNGTKATHLVKVDGSGNPVFSDGKPVLDEATAIDEANGYKIFRQAGKYYAIKFFEDIIDNDYYCGENRNHLDNQMDFIRSNYEGSKIAMLFDGNYWTNEAEEAIDSIVNGGFGASSANEVKDNFAVMPFPRPNATEFTGKNSYSIGANDLAFIYAEIPVNRVKAAKAFFQYLYTDEALKDYTSIVGAARGCDVEFNDNELSGLSEFAKSSLKYRAESDLSIPASSSAIYTNHMTDFIAYKIGTSATIDTDYSTAINYLINQGKKTDGTDSQKYFQGILKYYGESFWQNLVG